VCEFVSGVCDCESVCGVWLCVYVWCMCVSVCVYVSVYVYVLCVGV